MALIDCYECGKQISDAAPACPSCGAPKKKETYKIKLDSGKIYDTGETIEERNSRINQQALKQLIGPTCPLCDGSMEKITGVEGLFRGGIAGVAKKLRCRKCGHLA